MGGINFNMLQLNKLFIKNLVVVAFATMFLIVAPTKLFGVTFDKTKAMEDYQKLEQQIEENEVEYKKLKSSAASLQKQVDSLKRQISTVSRALNLVTRNVNSLQKSIKENLAVTSILDEKINIVRGNITDLNIFMVEMLNQPTLLLLVEDVNSYSTTLETVGIIEKRLLAQKKELETLQLEYVKARVEYESSKKDLASQQKVYVKTKETLAVKEALYKTQLSRLNRNARTKLSAINSMKKAQERLSQAIQESISSSNRASKSSNSYSSLSDSVFTVKKGKLQIPISGKVIKKFGKEYIADLKTTINRDGVEISPAKTSTVKAVYSGAVIYKDNVFGIGNVIIVQHSKSYYSIYGHLDSVFVRIGDRVSPTVSLGIVKADESRSEDYLYFGMTYKSKPINPSSWVKGL